MCIGLVFKHCHLEVVFICMWFISQTQLHAQIFLMRKTEIFQNRELCLKKHFAVSGMGDCNSWSSQVSALVTPSTVELM